MNLRVLMLTTGLVLLAVPVAHAQAVVRGAQQGVAVGNRAAGPVGAVVGGVVGAGAYAFRSGASRVIGVPEESGSARAQRSVTKKRMAKR